MTAIPYLSVLKATGEDAGAFLHGQLAANTEVLGVGQCSFAAYCSARGQVIALLLVCRELDGWRICVESRLALAVLERMRKFVMRAKVQLEILEAVRVLGMSPDSAEIKHEPVYTPAEFPLAYSFSKDTEAATDSSSAWREQELRHGVTWLQPDSSERFLPQMLGLDAIGAVSFNKGCYPGQEIIARTRYLGKLKRKPVLVVVNGLAGFTVGGACKLMSGQQEVDAVVADGVTVQYQQPGSASLLLVVAPLETEDAVSGLRLDKNSWRAERIYPLRQSS